MNHEQAVDRLDAYLDRELAADEEQAVARHLEACESCRLAVTAWQSIRGVIFGAPQVMASEAFVRGVMEKIQREDVFDIRSFVRWLVPTMALTCAALVLINVLPFSSNQSFQFNRLTPKGGSLFSVQEYAPVEMEAERDWMGLEAL